MTGDFIIPAPRAGGIASIGRDANVAGIGRRQSLHPPAQRLPRGVPAGSVHRQARRAAQREEHSERHLLLLEFPRLRLRSPTRRASPRPFTLRRADRNRTLAISDQHIFGPTLHQRSALRLLLPQQHARLDDPFLSTITNESVGIPNPARRCSTTAPATRRLGHFVGRPGTISRAFSFGGPNDSFNRPLAEDLQLRRQPDVRSSGNHTLRFGGEFKRHRYDTSLPEEQATEFEKFDNFTQFLRGVATEADTQFGVTEKSFRFRDLCGYVADDWKVTAS